jgi:hypothetical protein
MLNFTASYTHQYRNSSLSSLSKNCTERRSFPFHTTYTAPIRLQRRVTDLLSTQNNVCAALSNFVAAVFCVSENIAAKVHALHIQATPLLLMNLCLQQLAKTATFCNNFFVFSFPKLHPAKMLISGLISRIPTLDI